MVFLDVMFSISNNFISSLRPTRSLSKMGEGRVPHFQSKFQFSNRVINIISSSSFLLQLNVQASRIMLYLFSVHVEKKSYLNALVDNIFIEDPTSDVKVLISC